MKLATSERLAIILACAFLALLVIDYQPTQLLNSKLDAYLSSNLPVVEALEGLQMAGAVAGGLGIAALLGVTIALLSTDLTLANVLHTECQIRNVFEGGAETAICVIWLGVILLILAAIISLIATLTTAETETKEDDEESELMLDTQGDGLAGAENDLDIAGQLQFEVDSNKDTQQQQQCTQADVDTSFLEVKRAKTQQQYRYTVTYKVTGCSTSSTMTVFLESDHQDQVKTGQLKQGEATQETFFVDSKNLYHRSCIRLNDLLKCVSVTE